MCRQACRVRIHVTCHPRNRGPGRTDDLILALQLLLLLKTARDDRVLSGLYNEFSHHGHLFVSYNFWRQHLAQI